ncbi:MAG: hypothetical protein HGA45_28840 [Chloroflexales bacterium]|nr:hypothetical protein [Chloroflexales bacterium]
MRGFRFDWRWLILIGFIALLANAGSLPWPVTALALTGAGGAMLWMAWRSWGLGGWSGGRDTRRVTYWRGTRIETQGPPRRARLATWTELAPVVVYALLGTALLLAALAVLMRAL